MSFKHVPFFHLSIWRVGYLKFFNFCYNKRLFNLGIFSILMNDKLIEFKGVSKSFDENKVLDSLDFKIPEGKITGIIGASGEGKSTILKLIATFYKPTGGQIFYYNRDVFEDIMNVKKSFGFSIEEGSFYEDLTVRENLLYFGRLFGVKKEILSTRIEDLINFVGLSNARNVEARNLSLGMRKRLDIACALVHKPSVLVLDEPTADLDPLLRSQIMDLIKKINSQGTTIVFTTQLLKEADKLCDKIAILYNEKIAIDGSPHEVKKKYHGSDLDDVFKKIFSKKGRKTYQELKQKKTRLKEDIIKEEGKKEEKKEKKASIYEGIKKMFRHKEKPKKKPEEKHKEEKKK